MKKIIGVLGETAVAALIIASTSLIGCIEADENSQSDAVPEVEKDESVAVEAGKHIDDPSSFVEPTETTAVSEQPLFENAVWSRFRDNIDVVTSPQNEKYEVCAGQADGIKHAGKLYFDPKTKKEQCRIEYYGKLVYYVMPNTMAWYLKDDGGYNWCRIQWDNQIPARAVLSGIETTGSKNALVVCSLFVNDPPDNDGYTWLPGKFASTGSKKCYSEWADKIRWGRASEGSHIALLVKGTCPDGTITL